MTVGMVIGTFVYFLVTVGVALAALMDWNMNRDAAREFEDRTGCADIQARYERDARAAARRIVQSPLWPLLAIAGASRIYRDSKEDA